MLDRIDRDVLEQAGRRGRLTATVDLTDDKGAPRCARVDPPAIVWA